MAAPRTVAYRTLCFTAALALSAGAANAQEVRVGFLNTFTGGGAVIGEEMRKAWELALEHLDGKFGGLKAVTFYGDDQLKPEAGIAAVEKFLRQDKVHFVAGPIWSNVMIAVKNRVLGSNAILVSTNAGPSQLAGKECSPYFFSTSWQGDQVPEAMGQLMNGEKLSDVLLMAPNYQAGKDVLAGFERFYKGKVSDHVLFKIGTTDYQAEFASIRAKKPGGVFVFAPGAMGTAFMKQWAAAGLGKEIKLYTVFVINHVNLPAIGESAIGSYFADYWNAESDAPGNQRFLKGFLAKHKAHPSHFAAQAYDAAFLIDSGVKGARGKVDDRKALAVALRKADYESIRGKFSFNVNGFPIQDYYKFSVVKGASGALSIKTEGLVFRQHKDAYHAECKASVQ
jgi:branched-chain amino acid transport system substrate-binding protein